MGNIKYSELVSLIEAALGDLEMVVDISEPLDINKTKRITFANRIASIKRLLASGETPGKVLKVNSDASNLEFDHEGMSLIEEIVLSSPASSFDFSNIPDTLSHLKLMLSCRLTKTATFSDVLVQFNGDTGADYDYELLEIYSTSNPTTQFFGQTSALLGHCSAASADAGLSGNIVVFLPDYKGTTFNKSFSSTAAFKIGTSSGNLYLDKIAGFWRDSTAINQIRIIPYSDQFATGSKASLYGMK